MKRLTIIVFSIISFAALLYSNGQKEAYPDNFSLNVTALNGPTGIGMIYLFDENPPLGENINVQYNVALAPKVLIGDLAKEEIDIAVLPANMPALLYARKLNYKVAAITGLGSLYVVSHDTSISSLSDLRGKNVFNGAKGATPDFLARFLLKNEGIDLERDLYMDFSYGLPDLAKAVIGGLVDTAILPEPFVTMVTEKSDAEVILDFQEIWMGQQNSADAYPMSVLVIKEELVENYPLLVSKFLKAYSQSISKVNSNPAESAALVPKHGFTMSAEITEKAIPRINLKYIDGIECRELLGDYLTILHSLDPKIIGGAIPGEDLYYIEK